MQFFKPRQSFFTDRKAVGMDNQYHDDAVDTDYTGDDNDSAL